MADNVTSTHGHVALIVAYILTFIAFVFVALRTYTRWWVQNLYTLSDLLTALAWMFLVTDVILHTLEYTHGFWQDNVDFSPQSVLASFREDDKLEFVLQLAYAGNILYFSGLWCCKAGLCLLYYQLVPPEEKRLMRCLHAITTFCVVSYLFVLVMNLVWCSPPDRNWTFNNTCFVIFEAPPLYSSFALNVLTELCLMLIPLYLIRILWRMKTPGLTRRRIVMMAVTFSLIGVSIAIASASFVLLIGVASASVVALLNDIEQSIAIIIVCIPPLRTLLAQRWKKHEERRRKRLEAAQAEDQLTSLAPPPDEDDFDAAAPELGANRRLFALHDDGQTMISRRRSRADTFRSKGGLSRKTTAEILGENNVAPVRTLHEETGPNGLFAVGSGESTPVDERRSAEMNEKRETQTSPPPTPIPQTPDARSRDRLLSDGEAFKAIDEAYENL